MKIGMLLGLAIAVALVVVAMRWLRGRAAQKSGTVYRDAHSDTTPGFVYFGTGGSDNDAETANDDRASKGDDAGQTWVSFGSTTPNDNKADSSTDSASDSGGGDSGGGDGGD